MSTPINILSLRWRVAILVIVLAGSVNAYTRIVEQRFYSQEEQLIEEDLRFPANVIGVGQGAGTAADYDSFINGTVALYFDDSLDEEAYVAAQIPHTRSPGSDLELHFHWSPTTTGSGNVTWCVEYVQANINGTFPSSTTTICVSDPADGVIHKHQMSYEIVVNGSNITYSNMFLFRIYRDANSASDTYASDAALLEFDIHYFIDNTLWVDHYSAGAGASFDYADYFDQGLNTTDNATFAEICITGTGTCLNNLSISATPGGSDTQIQFNDNGAFNGTGNFYYDKSTDILYAPKYTFYAGDTDSGLYWEGGNQIAFAAGGTLWFHITPGTIYTKDNAVFASGGGNAAAPGITFTLDTDTGIYRNVSNVLGLAAGGKEIMKISDTGGTEAVHILPAGPGEKGLVIRDYPLQTANLLEFQDYVGAQMTYVDYLGHLSIGAYSFPTTDYALMFNGYELQRVGGAQYAYRGLSSAWASGYGNNYTISSYRPYFHIFTNGENTPVLSLAPNREVGINIGNSQPTAQLDVRSYHPQEEAAVFRGAASQTDNIIEVQNNTGSIKFAIKPGGNWTVEAFDSPGTYMNCGVNAAGKIVCS